ncbi:ABC transporter ATP-binding protein [Haloferula sargassicola]|uniref:Vitamin B12 import ATP-binding protein BtuD n=1 Tax=Haloferula sargassicola TaxID=490096 RepID=A0ABP9UNK8_9BACT
MSGPAIEIETLSKRYGALTALSEVAFEVPRGSVFGLLGPNGAGKSTLVKSLLTLVRPTRCAGRLLDRPIGDRRTLARIGYLPEHARFPDYLTGRQILRMSAGLSKVPKKAALAKEGPLLERVGMAERADDRHQVYSKGMKQRIGIAQALINDPELVFLDEPTDGVDPEGRVAIRHIIEQMRAEGRTVFVNSHLLGEVEQVADHVAILSQGRLVEIGRTEELTHRKTSYQLRTIGPVPFELKDRFQAEGMTVAGDTIELVTENPAEMQPVIDALRATDTGIREILERRQSLEQVFLDAIHGKGGA